MCSFVPTRGENGEWSTFLQSYHTQTPITLMKKSFAQIVLNGGFSSSLLNYVGTGLRVRLILYVFSSMYFCVKPDLLCVFGSSPQYPRIRWYAR
jgi:hypothetical protein